MPSKNNGKSKASKKTSKTSAFSQLRKYNLIVSLIYALQGVLILLLSDAQRGVQSVTSNYLANDKVASEAAGRTILSPASHHLFDINLAHVVAAFLLVGAIYHLIISTWQRKQYEKDLKNNINRLRWVQYALSVSIMMVAIALLSGVYDFASLVMIFALTAIMSLLGLTMELRNKGEKRVDWSNYWVGLTSGLVPWLVVIIYVWNAIVYGNGIAGYIYLIYGSLLILFGALVANIYLQYKRHGRWETYLYAEKVYIVLSLLAASALAWQIFVGTLK